MLFLKLKLNVIIKMLFRKKLIKIIYVNVWVYLDLLQMLIFKYKMFLYNDASN